MSNTFKLDVQTATINGIPGHPVGQDTRLVWRLDEVSGTATAVDAVGTYPLNTVNGTPTAVSAIFSRGRSFTTPAYLRGAADAGTVTHVKSNNWSIGMRVKFPSMGGNVDHHIFSLGAGGSQDVIFAKVWTLSAANVYFGSSSQGNTGFNVTTIVADTWYHFVFVRSGATIRLYQDSVDKGTIATSIIGTHTPASPVWSLANSAQGTAGAIVVDDFWFEDVAYDQTAVTADYNLPSTKALTILGNTDITGVLSVTSLALTASPLFIDAINNRVGINDATPSQALDVTGNVQFTGALMPGGTAGTTGQVLTSAGAGVAPTWAAAGGGSAAGGTGAVQFANSTAFAADAANFFWDDTNNRLGIGTNAPGRALDVYAAAAGVGLAQFKNTNTFGYSSASFLDDLAASKLSIGWANNDVTASTFTGKNFIHSPASNDIIVVMGASTVHSNFKATGELNVSSKLMVGSNVTTATQALDVFGRAHVREATTGVAGSWAMQIEKNNGTGALGEPHLVIGGSNHSGSSYYYTIGFGKTNSNQYPPAEIGLQTTDDATQSKGDLLFATRDVTTNTIPTERMRIKSNGDVAFDTNTLYVDAANNRVGIGTITPSSNLNIISNANSSTIIRVGNTDAGNVANAGMLADTNAGSAHFKAYGTGLATDGVIVANSGAFFTNNLSAGARVGTYDSTQLMLFTNKTSRVVVSATGDVAFDTNTLFVDAANNRVGIGTATPTFPVHVIGNDLRMESASIPRFSFNMTAAATDKKKWQFYAGSGGTCRFSALNDAEGSENIWLDVTRGTGTAIATVDFLDGNVRITDNLIVDTTTLVTDGANNRVGIGTATPGTSLHVLGDNIRIEAASFPKFSTVLSSAGADLKKWQSYAVATGLIHSAVNDAESGETIYLRVNRTSGITVASVEVPSGNFIVDTNTLFVDAANNRVGIGTATPANPLDVVLTGINGGINVDITQPTAPTTGITSHILQTTTDAGFTLSNPFYAWAETSGTGNRATSLAVEGDVYHGASGVMAQATGTAGYVENSGSGSITKAIALHSISPVNSGAGSIDTAVGVLIDEMVAGTTRYALHYDHPTNPLAINGDGTVTLQGGDAISRVAVPATASSTGTAGQVAWNGTHFYVCTATDTWVRTALATW